MTNPHPAKSHYYIEKCGCKWQVHISYTTTSGRAYSIPASPVRYWRKSSAIQAMEDLIAAFNRGHRIAQFAEYMESQTPPDPMQAAVDKAMEEFYKLSPAEQAAHRAEQRESWVRGEMAMGEMDKRQTSRSIRRKP